MNKPPSRENDIKVLSQLLRLAGYDGSADETAQTLISFYGSVAEVGCADDDSLAKLGIGCGNAPLLRFYAGYVTHLEGRQPHATDQYGLRWRIFNALCDLEREQLLIYPVLENDGIAEPEIIYGWKNIAATAPRAERMAKEHQCRYLILAHNHPRGDCRPSDSDIRATRIFNREISDHGLLVIDHYIVSRKGIRSMKELGKYFEYE